MEGIYILIIIASMFIIVQVTNYYTKLKMSLFSALITGATFTLLIVASVYILLLMIFRPPKPKEELTYYTIPLDSDDLLRDELRDDEE